MPEIAPVPDDAIVGLGLVSQTMPQLIAVSLSPVPLNVPPPVAVDEVIFVMAAVDTANAIFVGVGVPPLPLLLFLHDRAIVVIEAMTMSFFKKSKCFIRMIFLNYWLQVVVVTVFTIILLSVRIEEVLTS
ncbi:hypothetical protein [Mucilaginibacter frigoritolerans]|uniref:hypothetical protein n=1 Tax=Mucilaginibacter frigoritolerans TaxID=652788 RepID=UPI001477410E|nr:hypothetical protein [Mucilaginibacter frigoritolerans]